MPEVRTEIRQNAASAYSLFSWMDASHLRQILNGPMGYFDLDTLSITNSFDIGTSSIGRF